MRGVTNVLPPYEFDPEKAHLVESDEDADYDEQLPEICSATSCCLACCDSLGHDKSAHPGCWIFAFPPPVRVALAVITMFILYLIYVVLIGNVGSAVTKESVFNSTKANNIIGALCAEYTAGKVAGGLCHRLCTEPNYSIVDLYDGGAKTVIKLRSEGKDVILKMEKPAFADFDQLDFRISEDEFTDTVLDLVNDRLFLEWPRHFKKYLLRKLFPPYSGKLSNAERASIWALINQDEFLSLKLLASSRALPLVIDTCGHIYQSEYLIPFRMKGYYLNLKAKILLHLIGTLKLFDEFLNEPLQMCDVKFENLGLSGEYPKRFMVMDADMLYTKSKLDHMLTTKQCKVDSDCPIFDCDSRCNATTGYCTSRVNDNIDVFCTKLIKRIFGNYWSKNNRYLAACHEASPVNHTKRLDDLRLTWSWSLSEL
uniref:PIP49_C domain-containing protein n=1 Tax=Panagrellus redivivus TaxID=6233 RepID=A0A7E4VVP2_PANRE